ncbi:hypothetical protein [Streptomyces lavendulae]|uniref:hypothetical protein n=1 Tax=Streptomyces lavendulae TaxID=1914 RepID=UPI0037FCC72F
MTDPQTDPQTDVQADRQTAPQTDVQADPQSDVQSDPQDPVTAPGRPARRRGRALVASGLAVAVLAAGGAWAAVALADADRHAPTRYWAEPDESASAPPTPAPVPPNDLSGKLLPVPPAFSPGPDLADDGNNFFVSGGSAVQGFKDAGKGLSNTQRKQRDEALAGLKLKGLAGRSYAQAGGRTVVEVRIMQADPKALGTFAEISKKLLDQIGDGRDAPKVDGFPAAKCSMTALGEEKKETVDSLDCVAVEGDVMVNFRAYGPKPLSTGDAMKFLKNQLTHLKSPGESV